MFQPGTGSRVVLALIWLVVGAAMVGVPAWLGVTRWAAILNGHPVMLATAIACGMAGVVALAWAVASLILGGRVDREVDPEGRQRRTAAQLRWRAAVRIALALPALAVCVPTIAVLFWARPYPAEPVAVAALRSADDVQVSDRLTWYEMVSVKRSSDGAVVKPTVGFVFHPGARVDPRGYARVLRPLASAGFLVVVLKDPFNLAVLDDQHAARAMAVHPEIGYWAVGGHSLGGVTAASFADRNDQVKGLVLYASYPPATLARADLAVLSVSGDRDRFTTPADVAASKAKLPKTARYVVIPGAVHSSFGNYGEQDGDGVPAVDREQAQQVIATQTAALLAALPPKPKKK